MMKTLYLIVLIFLLSGCEKESLQFFPQNRSADTSDLERGFITKEEFEKRQKKDYSYGSDVIVVISLPEDNLKAIQVVDQYIAKNYQGEEILKYSMLRLLFLKESSDTKRIYEPWDEYVEYLNGGRQVPRFNPDDAILEVTWNQEIRNGKLWAFRMYNFRNDFSNDCPYRAMFWLDDKKNRFRDNCSTEQRTAVEQYFKGARADKIW